MRTIIALALVVTATASFAETPSITNKFRVAQVSLKCGIAPIPPIGCRVGACVCDPSGRNCQWTYVCN